jgi:large subunit ribosomal protein L23
MALINKIKNKFNKKEDKKVEKITNGKKIAKTKAIDKKDGQKQNQKQKTSHGEYADILIKPLVTEKSTELGAENKYVFIVSKRTNKNQISKAVQTLYQIKPVKINIVNNKGKRKRLGRIWGKRKDIKKAIVTLPQGKKLDIYEGV